MADLGIYHYGARFYSPYINRFLSADTIVPGYANPQNLNRYSYVTNNPLRYTDPTGHERLRDGPVDDDFSQSVFDEYVPLPDNDDDEDETEVTTSTPSISLTYDSQVFVNQYLPFTATQWGNASLFLDRAALGIDVLAALIVLGHVGVGAAGGLTFEGNPVTGGAGAAAGYILGEMNPVVRGLVGLGNGLATFATYAGIVQAEKTGDVRLVASANIGQSGIGLSAQAYISGNTAASVGLTAAGLLAQPVSVSLPLQLLAVMNDEGSFPLPAIDVGIGQ
jgi:RHS repeat-associated protein